MSFSPCRPRRSARISAKQREKAAKLPGRSPPTEEFSLPEKAKKQRREAEGRARKLGQRLEDAAVDDLLQNLQDISFDGADALQRLNETAQSMKGMAQDLKSDGCGSKLKEKSEHESCNGSKLGVGVSSNASKSSQAVSSATSSSETEIIDLCSETSHSSDASSFSSSSSSSSDEGSLYEEEDDESNSDEDDFAWRMVRARARSTTSSKSQKKKPPSFAPGSTSKLSDSKRNAGSKRSSAGFDDAKNESTPLREKPRENQLPTSSSPIPPLWVPSPVKPVDESAQNTACDDNDDTFDEVTFIPNVDEQRDASKPFDMHDDSENGGYNPPQPDKSQPQDPPSSSTAKSPPKPREKSNVDEQRDASETFDVHDDAKDGGSNTPQAGEGIKTSSNAPFSINFSRSKPQPQGRPSSSTVKSPPKPHEKSCSRGEAKENVPNNSNCPPPKKGFDPAQAASSARSNKKPLSEARRQYTKEQAEAVEEILRAKGSGKGSHYRVLGISNDASNPDVKKAYRRNALKLHPDKNQAPNSGEAFKALASAYDALKSPTKRAEYDRLTASRNGMPCSTTNTYDHYAPGSSIYNTFPCGLRVTLHNLDAASNHLYGMKGTVVAFQPEIGKYRVMLDNGPDNCLFSNGAVDADPRTLLQNIIVWPRSGFGLCALVTSYQQHLDLYEVGFPSNGTQLTCAFASHQIIIPNGSIVRLEGLQQRPEFNGKYGKLMSWTQRTDQYGFDTSYYIVQLSLNNAVHVRMSNVRL